MTRAEIYTRYRSTIDVVSIKNDVDVKVAEDMVRAVCEVRTKYEGASDPYEGVDAEFPCEKYLADFLGCNEL